MSIDILVQPESGRIVVICVGLDRVCACGSARSFTRSEMAVPMFNQYFIKDEFGASHSKKIGLVSAHDLYVLLCFPHQFSNGTSSSNVTRDVSTRRFNKQQLIRNVPLIIDVRPRPAFTALHIHRYVKRRKLSCRISFSIVEP